MAVALVEDVGGSGLQRHGAPGGDVVDVGVGDVEDARQVGAGVVGDVHLHAARAPVRLRPAAQLAERDRGRVDQPERGAGVAPGAPVDLAREHGEGLREDRRGAARAGVRQRRARHGRRAEVVMVLGAGVPARLEGAQARHPAELGEDERDEVLPAAEALVIGVGVVARDGGGEFPPVEGFKQLGEDGRRVAHAPILFLSLDNQKIHRISSENPGFRGMQPRPIESPKDFPRTAVRSAEKGRIPMLRARLTPPRLPWPDRRGRSPSSCGRASSGRSAACAPSPTSGRGSAAARSGSARPPSPRAGAHRRSR